MKILPDMYSFSSKLWFDKRWISKSGEASIYLQVTLDGKHKEFPLKLKWPVAFIDLATGLLMPRRKQDADVSDYNLIVRIEQSKHTDILRTYRIKKAPLDIRTFCREVKVFDKKESFVSFMKRDVLTRYALKEIDKRTYLNHVSAIHRMEVFDQAWPFERLNLTWLKRFKLTLINAGYQPGTIWTFIKNIKTYLVRAMAEPLLHVDQGVADFPNPLPKWKTTFLSRVELNSLITLYRGDIIAGQDLEILRAFLFTCFTSLRISDVYRVNGKWALTDGYLDFIPKKNEKAQKWIHIPIMPLADSFVKNTAGKYFDLPTEQEYNRTLKLLTKRAGIRKRVTSHVGRHTFGYLYMTTIGNLKGLQEILGHSNIATTERYAHLDDEYQKQSVLKIQAEFSSLFKITNGDA